MPLFDLICEVPCCDNKGCARCIYDTMSVLKKNNDKNGVELFVKKNKFRKKKSMV